MLSSLNGINDAGQAVGYYNDSTLVHGIVDTVGKVTLVDVPFAAGAPTQVTGSNDVGQLVGSYRDAPTTAKVLTASNRNDTPSTARRVSRPVR